MLAWPANSCDLNPLDYGLWGIWQQEINNSDQSTDSDAALRAQVLAQHGKVDKHVRAAILSWPRWLKACLAADGGHFEVG